MKFLKTLLFLFFLFVYIVIYSQNKKNSDWNGKKCAVVLTYDDALDVQLDNVIPVLDSAGLRGTFYLPGKAKTLQTRLSDWRKAAEKGHELGNHTLFHPCFGKSKNRKWVNPDFDLDNYSVNKMVEEIKVMNTFLHAIDGKTKRTFAYACGDREINGVYYIDKLKKNIEAARGVEQGLNFYDDLDIYNLKIYGAKNVSGDELIKQVKNAEKKGALLIFLFHGVGGGHTLNVSKEAHEKLVRYLSNKKDKIWTTPLIDVADFYYGSK
jgi:peptidoglycan/xylan/chitin deacetylase (PgdA/CDA1 family)